jgi:hypothetical protein
VSKAQAKKIPKVAFMELEELISQPEASIVTVLPEAIKSVFTGFGKVLIIYI